MNFVEYFKNTANAKQLTSAHMFALCVYKTVRAKSENKKEILDYFIKRTFTAGAVKAHRNHPYQAAIAAHEQLNGWTRPTRVWIKNEGFKEFQSYFFGYELTELMSEEEAEMFKNLIREWSIT